MAENKAHVDVKRHIHQFADTWKKNIDEIEKKKGIATLEEGYKSDLAEQMAKFKEEMVTKIVFIGNFFECVCLL